MLSFYIQNCINGIRVIVESQRLGKDTVKSEMADMWVEVVLAYVSCQNGLRKITKPSAAHGRDSNRRIPVE
jgi:hypothetical protein